MSIAAFTIDLRPVKALHIASFCGQTAVVECLTNKFAVDVNEQTNVIRICSVHGME